MLGVYLTPSFIAPGISANWELPIVPQAGAWSCLRHAEPLAHARK